MKKKTLTLAEKTKKVREMANSILVRNHIFTMVNTGRVNKSQKSRALQFVDYIDREVLQTCFDIIPDNVEPIKNSINPDLVKAREKIQREVSNTLKTKENAKS